MKILYFLTNYPYYSETFVAEEVKQLIAAKHDVVICNFTWYKKEQDNLDERVLNNTKNPFRLFASIFKNLVNGESLLFNGKSLKFIFSCVKKRPDFLVKYVYMLFSLDYMYSQIKNENFDIAISHFLFKSTLAGRLLCEKLNKPYHIRLHTKRSLYPEHILKDVLNSSQAITAESKDVGDFYQQYLNQQYEIKVIRQSINLDKLSLIKGGALTESKVNIIAIGRLVEKKGFEVLINAVAKCKEQIKNKIQLKIYGDGPLMDQLSNLIAENNLKSSIELMGMLEHTPLMKMLAQADLLVVPSIELENDIDGVPTVIAEAMAVKTPVLATPIAGINEMVVDRETGFVVSENNVNELSDTLTFLIDNESERSKVIDEAFSKVSKEYRLTLAEEIDNNY